MKIEGTARPRRVIIAAVLLTFGGQDAMGQGTTTAWGPESVARRYAEALLSRSWTICAALVHPDELSRIRASFLPVFERDSTAELPERILGVPNSFAWRRSIPWNSPRDSLPFSSHRTHRELR
jgi:hypothetical protein